MLQAWAVQGNARQLIAAARSESSLELRAEAVRQLSMLDSDEAKAYLMELLED